MSLDLNLKKRLSYEKNKITITQSRNHSRENNSKRVMKHIYGKNRKFLSILLANEKKKMDNSLIRQVMPEKMVERRYKTINNSLLNQTYTLNEPIDIKKYINLNDCSYFSFLEILTSLENILNISFDWRDTSLLTEWFEKRLQYRPKEAWSSAPPVKVLNCQTIREYFDQVKVKYHQKIKQELANPFKGQENKESNFFQQKARQNKKKDNDNTKTYYNIFVKLLNESLIDLNKHSKDGVELIADLFSYILDYNNIETTKKVHHYFDQFLKEKEKLDNEIITLKKRLYLSSKKISKLVNDNIKLKSKEKVQDKSEEILRKTLKQFNVFYLASKVRDNRYQNIHEKLNEFSDYIDKIDDTKSDYSEYLSKLNTEIKDNLEKIVSLKSQLEPKGQEIIEYSLTKDPVKFAEPISVGTNTAFSNDSKGCQVHWEIKDTMCQTELNIVEIGTQTFKNTKTRGVMCNVMNMGFDVKRNVFKSRESTFVMPSFKGNENKIKISIRETSIEKMHSLEKIDRNLLHSGQKLVLRSKSAEFDIERYFINKAKYNPKIKVNKNEAIKIARHLYSALRELYLHKKKQKMSFNRLSDTCAKVLKELLTIRAGQDPISIVFTFFYNKSRKVKFVKKMFTAFLLTILDHKTEANSKIKILQKLISISRFNLVEYNVALLSLIFSNLLP